MHIVRLEKLVRLARDDRLDVGALASRALVQLVAGLALEPGADEALRRVGVVPRVARFYRGVERGRPDRVAPVVELGLQPVYPVGGEVRLRLCVKIIRVLIWAMSGRVVCHYIMFRKRNSLVRLRGRCSAGPRITRSECGRCESNEIKIRIHLIIIPYSKLSNKPPREYLFLNTFHKFCSGWIIMRREG